MCQCVFIYRRGKIEVDGSIVLTTIHRINLNQIESLGKSRYATSSSPS